MTYITGDTHRTDFYRIENLCAENETTVDDVIVILGDVGINYEGEPDDSKLKSKLSQLPITMLCIHGNHEMRPESIRSYEETERFGGVVYWEPKFPNLLFAKDGEIYELEGYRCIAIGGAYSIDKHQRKEGINWWADEQPSGEIMKRVKARLESENWKVDIVFSHTCPIKYLPSVNYIFIELKHVDKSTEKWLQSIEETLDYSYWLCGHFHTEKSVGKMRFVFREILYLRGAK